ncbi:MAG TPA: hypothetical protein VFH93_03530 [Thermoleophilia bacterium]|nr:hypothetical protein [Thermoleophilia bacterium]
MGTSEWIVVISVVGARLLLPLAIPYFPLVGIIACLILDAFDQVIFRQFKAIDLSGYQQYDKALDIYYLAIAFTATMRNWTSRPAFRTSQFLWFYRLVGVVAFELTQVRVILLIFPNTFEYFFIFVEAVRLRWKQSHIGWWTAIVGAAIIWVFIKLPQEYWIHIGKWDTTTVIKTILTTPALLIAVVGGAVLIVAAFYWGIKRNAPPGDHPFTLRADPLPPECRGADLYRTARVAEKLFDWALAEKAVFLGLVSVIFAQILPGVALSNFGVLIFVSVFVTINALVSQAMARRGRAWNSVAVELGGMAIVNLVIVLLMQFFDRVVGIIDNPAPVGTTLFFVFLVTVLTVLFDRYRTILTARGVLERTSTT